MRHLGLIVLLLLFTGTPAQSSNWPADVGLVEQLREIRHLNELHEALAKAYPHKNIKDMQSLVGALDRDLPLDIQFAERLSRLADPAMLEEVARWYANDPAGKAVAEFERRLLERWPEELPKKIYLSAERWALIQKIARVLPHQRWRARLEWESQIILGKFSDAIAGQDDQAIDYPTEEQFQILLDQQTGFAVRIYQEAGKLDDATLERLLTWRSASSMARFDEAVEESLKKISLTPARIAAERLGQTLGGWGIPYAALEPQPKAMGESLDAFRKRQVNLLLSQAKEPSTRLLKVRASLTEAYDSYPAMGELKRIFGERTLWLREQDRRHLSQFLRLQSNDPDGLLWQAHLAMLEGKEELVEEALKKYQQLKYPLNSRWHVSRAVLAYARQNYEIAYKHYRKAGFAQVNDTPWQPSKALAHAYVMATRRMRDFDAAEDLLKHWHKRYPDDPERVTWDMSYLVYKLQDPELAEQAIAENFGTDWEGPIRAMMGMVYLQYAVERPNEQGDWLAKADGLINNWIWGLLPVQDLRDPIPAYRLLLETGRVRIDDVPSNGMHPLHSAASAGDQQLVASYLELGADVNLEGCCGTPLALALFCGSIPTANFLFRNGAEPEAAFSSQAQFDERMSRRSRAVQQDALELLKHWGWEP
ncbi:MAG: ankyrin repeat domain-containing protein [Pseudomonadota bacterium]